ncbi:type VI secretion system membrane subunit TssM [Albidovulum sediminicola]|uniref:Type VI secretion system membrane subunit TssM n=1 Tax=Albidovulum sediminicola TaxID=2984331 RepID=A0ABT2Z0E6_9RHOB|nr:type VI secretion system membrane subunit TssM [Defluviimonas sp. WL0075]MCV2864487.1 type VI secretion system membrane subunit TssM [Defluviimonas sp. WL0075]
MIFRKIRHLLGTLNFVILILAIIFGGLIWYFGPLFHWGDWRPLDSVMSRAITIAAMFVIAFLIMTLRWFLRRRRNRKMEEDLTSVEAEPDMTAQELAELRDKMKTALGALRKSKLGRRHLYELPWYVMIGPPGAGKTTAIVNSGLQFPLAEAMGKSAIGGVGGTRNCDWWFTDNAVMIDTAGRYTTQESDAETDSGTWLGFLSLLKKYRKRQPINGAMIAISLSDLSMQDETTQKEHANAVRRRLHELREKLGVRFPVYVLFTKADLIAGFSEFYDTLGKEDREQVWGFTFPLEKSKGEVSPIANFDQEFSLLLQRLNGQSLEKLQSETDHQRRSLIAAFPGQVASVRQVARDFLAQVFQDNRFEQRHMLRGVYFTSGTQEGTPIDRLMMNMARTFGIGRQAIGSGRGTGRSFFLTRLFENVIFREAGLVSADDKVERRYRWTKRIAITAMTLLAIGGFGLWARSFMGNRDMIANAATQADTFQQMAEAIPGSPIGDTDLPAIVPALNILRDMPGNPALGDPEPDGALTWGLYQGQVIGTQAQQTYRAALNTHFLPRLLLRLEEQMQANMNNHDFLYEALKIYLMLGLQGPMNQDMIAEWMKIDWSLAYPGPSREEMRADLSQHLEAMLTQPMQEILLNGPLVEQVQGILSEMSLAQRIYNGIVNSPAAAALPAWRLSEVGGPAISRVMLRNSGKALTDGVEGIFTYNGFNNVFLGEALGVAKRIQSESWVLGPRGASEQSEAALLAISRDVLDLYYNDYIARYDGILSDLDIVPMESLSHAVEVTNVLSGPTSPITNVLMAIAAETNLTQRRGLVETSGVTEGLSQVGQLELHSNLDVQSQIFLNALTSSTVLQGEQTVAPKQPGEYVTDRFSWLHDLVARGEGQPSQLDLLMQTLTLVYQELNKMSFSGGVAQPTGEVSALQQFQQEAGRLPGPMQRWATQISSGSSGITAGGTRASINARWQATVLPFCEQALDNRYPFTRGSRADIAIADFAKLFAPSGMIDSFFNENLFQYVDTRARPWSWKKVNDVDLGISASVLQQFQYAAEIRDAFFAGGPTPAVSFQVTPEALDPKAKKVTLNIDGTEIVFNHREPAPVAVTWPGGVGVAKLELEPSAKNAENSFMKDGPWAWFRMLDAADVRATNVADRNRVIFNVGGRIAIFQLQAGSVFNPFALPAISKFACPKSF